MTKYEAYVQRGKSTWGKKSFHQPMIDTYVL
jgi:hypothetical protein